MVLRDIAGRLGDLDAVTPAGDFVADDGGCCGLVGDDDFCADRGGEDMIGAADDGLDLTGVLLFDAIVLYIANRIFW